MRVNPQTTAAYEAVQRLVDEHNLAVEVDDPRLMKPIPTSFAALIASSDPAYAVQLIINPGAIAVHRTGRFGLGNHFTHVQYPTAHMSSGLHQHLVANLLPVLRRELELAAGERTADYAEHGPTAVYEARDAVRRLD